MHALSQLFVWGKARHAPPLDPNEYRYDEYNQLIRWKDYGDRSSSYGWEVDHITPKAFGGTDDPWNLRALNCRQNASNGGAIRNLFRDLPQKSEPAQSNIYSPLVNALATAKQRQAEHRSALLRELFPETKPRGLLGGLGRTSEDW